MVHIQYLKVAQAVEKKSQWSVTLHSEGTIFSDSRYCGHIHDLSDTLYYWCRVPSALPCASKQILQMQTTFKWKKSKALDDFYIPNSGEVLEMYFFSCDEWLAVDLLVPLQIWVHATKVWHRRRCKVQRNNAHQTRVHSGKMLIKRSIFYFKVPV